jgi:prevent-host-death family protein
MTTQPTVGVRELKARLGSYLRRVKSGETLVVTWHGRPIAVMRPIGPDEPDESDGQVSKAAARAEGLRTLP